VEDHDLDRLERNIEEVQARLRELADEDRFRVLIPIIKKRGWTTPAELYHFSSTLDVVGRELEIIDKLSASLIEGSLKASVKEVAAV
jgi:hypothetical protein